MAWIGDPYSSTTGSGALGEPTSWWDLAKATYESMHEVDNSNARRIAMERAADEIIDGAVRAGIKDHGLVNPAYALPRGEPDFTRGAAFREQEDDPVTVFERRRTELAAKYPEQSALFKADRPLIELARERARTAEEHTQSTAQRYGGWAPTWTASLSGGIVGSVYDPINIAALAAGPWGRVAPGARAVLAQGVKTGLVNVGAQAMVEPFSQMWRQEAGLGYGLSHAALSLASAFGLGFGLDVGIRGTARAIAPRIGLEQVLDERGKVSGYRARQPAQAPAAGGEATPRPKLPGEPVEPPQAATPEPPAAGGRPRLPEVQPRPAPQPTGPDTVIGMPAPAPEPTPRVPVEAIAAARPDIRGARQTAETQGRIAEAPSPFMDEADRVERIVQALRSGVDETEPPPRAADPVMPARQGHANLGDDGPAPPSHYTIDGKPVSFQPVPARAVGTDAAVFQFKGGTNAEGVALKEGLLGVTRWDPLAAGRVFIFQRADGSIIIADGHQRLALAKRLEATGHPPIDMNASVFREVDGWTPQDVKALAAKKNMQEGRANALDMATILRERPDIMADGSVPRTATTVRQANALARLSEDAWASVVSGEVEPNHAAVVGELVDARAQHGGVMDVLARLKDEIRNEQHVRNIVNDLVRSPPHLVNEILLGGDPGRGLLAERADVLDQAMKILEKDRRIFTILVEESQRIEAVGNKLALNENADRVLRAEMVREVFGYWSNRPGPVRDWLTEAARDAINAGGKRKDFAAAGKAFADRVRTALERDGINALKPHESPPLNGGRGIDEPGGAQARAQVATLEADLQAAMAKAMRQVAERNLDQWFDWQRLNKRPVPDIDPTVRAEALRLIAETGESVPDAIAKAQADVAAARGERLTARTEAAQVREEAIAKDAEVNLPAYHADLEDFYRREGLQWDLSDADVRALARLMAEGRTAEQALLEFRPDQVSGFRDQVSESSLTPETQNLKPRRIVTPGGEMEIEARPEVVELASLKHAEGDLQPRDRSRAESEVEVRRRAAKLDPEQLQPGRVSDSGAPVVAEDGTILSGNGRVMSLRLVYQTPAFKRQADAYRASLGTEAEGLREPVVIMRAQGLSPEDARTFVDLSNRSRIAAMSATERAQRDAQMAGPEIMARYQGGEFTAPQNYGFFRAFVDQVVAPAERGSIAKNGVLTKEGQDRMSSALLAAAYGDADLLSRMLESTDDNVRSISNALRDVAGRFVGLKASIASGVIKPDFDITAQMAQAIRQIADLRRRGIKVSEYLSQTDLEGRDPVVEGIIRFLYNDALTRQESQKVIARHFSAYVDEALHRHAQALFEDPSTPADILAAARARVARERAAEEGSGTAAAGGGIHPAESSGGDIQAGGAGGEQSADGSSGRVPLGTQAALERLRRDLRRRLGLPDDDDSRAALGGEPDLALRESAARAVMETDVWRQAAEPPADQSRVTAKQPGYGSLEWRAARRYVDSAGREIKGWDAAVAHIVKTASDAIEGGVEKGKRAVILIGYPGAGKSTVARPLSRALRAAHITADDAKRIIPEYEGGANTWGVQRESAELAVDASRALVMDGRNVIIETLGRPEHVEPRLQALDSLGYNTTIVHVDVPKAVAMERAVARFNVEGRASPASIYDTLDAGGLYAKAKEAKSVDGTATLRWDEGIQGWRVAEASDDGIRDALTDAAITELARARAAGQIALLGGGPGGRGLEGGVPPEGELGPSASRAPGDRAERLAVREAVMTGDLYRVHRSVIEATDRAVAPLAELAHQIGYRVSVLELIDPLHGGPDPFVTLHFRDVGGGQAWEYRSQLSDFDFVVEWHIPPTSTRPGAIVLMRYGGPLPEGVPLLPGLRGETVLVDPATVGVGGAVEHPVAHSRADQFSVQPALPLIPDPTRGFQPVGALAASVVPPRRGSLDVTFDRAVRGDFLHGLVHALKHKGVLTGAIWDRLVAHAEHLKIMERSEYEFDLRTSNIPLEMTAADLAAGLHKRTIAEGYRLDDASLNNLSERQLEKARLDKQEEGVTHLLQLVYHGGLSEADAAPIRGILQTIFKGKWDEIAQGLINANDNALNPRRQPMFGLSGRDLEALVAAKAFHDQVASGKKATIAASVVDWGHDTVRPHLDLLEGLPEGHAFGFLAHFEPLFPGSDFGRATYRMSDGSERHLHGSWSKKFSMRRAAYESNVQGILFHRFVAADLDAGGPRGASRSQLLDRSPELRGSGSERLGADPGSGSQLSDSLIGELLHEIYHARRANGLIDDATHARLVSHGEKLRVLDMGLDAYLAKIKRRDSGASVSTASLKERYERIYSTYRDPKASVAEEYPTHLLELAWHGQISKEDLAPVRHILEKLFAGTDDRMAKRLAALDTAPKFALAGPKALTADLARLEMAQAMEGRGRTGVEIYEATNWFRGANGEWMFRLPDAEIQLKPGAAKTARGQGRGRYTRPGPLQNIVSAPEHFAAYPQLGQASAVLQHRRTEAAPRGIAGVDQASGDIAVMAASAKQARVRFVEAMRAAIDRIENRPIGTEPAALAVIRKARGDLDTEAKMVLERLAALDDPRWQLGGDPAALMDRVALISHLRDIRDLRGEIDRLDWLEAWRLMARALDDSRFAIGGEPPRRTLSISGLKAPEPAVPGAKLPTGTFAAAPHLAWVGLPEAQLRANLQHIAWKRRNDDPRVYGDLSTPGKVYVHIQSVLADPTFAHLNINREGGDSLRIVKLGREWDRVVVIGLMKADRGALRIATAFNQTRAHTIRRLLSAVHQGGGEAFKWQKTQNAQREILHLLEQAPAENQGSSWRELRRVLLESQRFADDQAMMAIGGDLDPRSPLLAHPSILRLVEFMLERVPPMSNKDIAAAIKERTGVAVTAGQVRAFANRLVYAAQLGREAERLGLPAGQMLRENGGDLRPILDATNTAKAAILAVWREVQDLRRRRRSSMDQDGPERLAELEAEVVRYGLKDAKTEAEAKKQFDAFLRQAAPDEGAARGEGVHGAGDERAGGAADAQGRDADVQGGALKPDDDETRLAIGGGESPSIRGPVENPVTTELDAATRAADIAETLKVCKN